MNTNRRRQSSNTQEDITAMNLLRESLEKKGRVGEVKLTKKWIAGLETKIWSFGFVDDKDLKEEDKGTYWIVDDNAFILSDNLGFWALNMHGEEELIKEWVANGRIPKCAADHIMVDDPEQPPQGKSEEESTTPQGNDTSTTTAITTTAAAAESVAVEVYPTNHILKQIATIESMEGNIPAALLGCCKAWLIALNAEVTNFNNVVDEETKDLLGVRAILKFQELRNYFFNQPNGEPKISSFRQQYTDKVYKETMQEMNAFFDEERKNLGHSSLADLNKLADIAKFEERLKATVFIDSYTTAT